MPDDSVHQPQTVSDQISKYLKTSSNRDRHRAKDDEQPNPPGQQPLIDNEGLELDEGNDLA